MVAKRRTRKEISERARLFGAPEPEVFKRSGPGAALAESAPIHFKEKRDQDRLLALEKLALDILHNPDAARAFAVNPEEYLHQAGFSRRVKLDLNSREVRIAMAMGDPAVREAARRADVDGFIDAVIAQGIKPSIGPAALFGVELAVWFSAVLVSWVAAAYTVETAVTVHHKIGVAGSAFLTVQHHMDMLGRIAERVGDPALARKVRSRTMERFVEQYVDLHKDVEQLE